MECEELRERFMSLLWHGLLLYRSFAHDLIHDSCFLYSLTYLLSCFLRSGKFDGKPIEYNGEECQVIRDDNVLLSYTGVTLRLDTVIPVRDYVLIQLDGNTSGAGGDQPVMTSSGVVIAAAVLKDNAPCEGRVVKIGEGRMASTGQLTQSPVRIGDMVKFKDYAGNDVLIEGKAYSVVKMVDILCTFTAGDETTAASE